MKHPLILRLTLVGLLLVASSQLNAQDVSWGQKMVEKRAWHIDCKDVASGQWVELKVRVTNIYNEDIQIRRVASPAGCLSWRAIGNDLCLESPINLTSRSEIVLSLIVDTMRFTGQQMNRKAQITFSNTENGLSDIATILVDANIRSDRSVPKTSIPVRSDFGSTLRTTDADFGQMIPGESKRLNVAVGVSPLNRSPFVIENVTSSGPCKLIPNRSTNKPGIVQTVTLDLTAHDTAGPFEQDVTFVLSDQRTISIKAYGEVVESPDAVKN